MKLHTTLLVLPTVILSSRCPDIIDDPYLDFSGAGINNDLSKLTFFQSCGPISGSTGSNATDKDNSQFSESVCRIKCNDWNSSRKNAKKDVKLFWVKTRNKWKRTKYLQCQCNTNTRGVETCKYKRRGYNYNEERGRSGAGNKLQIACSDPVCENPGNIDELNSAGIGQIKNPDKNVDPVDSSCTNCDINKSRGGTWKCFDKNGDELEIGESVPWKGYCMLTCGFNSKFDIKKKIVCKNPHIQGFQQYDPIWRLYKFLNLNKYKKNEFMSAEIGWQCNSGLVEGSERVQAVDEDEDIESDEDYDDVDDIDEDDE